MVDVSVSLVHRDTAGRDDEGFGSGAWPAGAPAMLSPVAGGLVRTWRGHWAALWRVDDARRLRILTAAGWAGRIQHRDGRVRAVGEIQRDGARFRLRIRIGAHHPDPAFAIAPAGSALADVVAEAHWDELFFHFAVAVDSVMRSGEALLVERGGRDVAGAPECFIMAFDEGDGPRVVVEADPVPHGNAVWGRIPDGVEACGIVVPADMSRITGAGLYMLECVRFWGWTPWDVVLTRIPHPSSTLRETPDGITYAVLAGAHRPAAGGR